MSQRFNDQELEALFHKNLPQDPIPVALSNRIKQEVLAEVNATLRESAQTRGAYSSARDGNWLNRIFGGLPKIQIGPSMVMAGTMAVAILLIVVNIPSIVSMLNLDAPTPVSGDVVHPDSSPTPTLTMQVAISVTNTVATTIAPTESPTHTKIATESPTATPSPTTTETPTATLTESKKAEVVHTFLHHFPVVAHPQ